MILRNRKSMLNFCLTLLMAISALFIHNKETNATSLTFHATDDSWMWGSSSMSGTASTMNVQSSNGKQSYLKFTVSGAGTVTSATLSVKCVTGGTATIGAYAGSGTGWTESSLAWNNAPAVGSLLDSKSVTFVAGTVYTFDVSSLITGDGTYSIVLAGTSGDEVVFSTKEGSYAPQIVTSGGSTSNTFNTTDDSWMWGSSSMSGTASTMNVQGSNGKQSYLKFTVSGAGTVTNTTLSVKCVTGGTAAIGAYAGTGNSGWTESSLAWNNEPAVGSLLDSKSVTFVAGTVYTFDVSSLITGDGTYSIVLAGTSGDEVVFSTKEGSYAPQIAVSGSGGGGSSYNGPSLSGYSLLRDYSFGTSRNVNSLTALANAFNPYGIAGTTVINNEWQRYQTFNDTNHHLTSTTLDLTATANLGGVYNGGISSGQITTKETFYPSDGKTYMFQLRAKIPEKTGAWPAFWLYSPGGAGTTSSEIDIFEFFDTPTQNTYDYTGYDHGSGVGSDYYSIMTNQWVWHPGFDFAADYHTYTLIWKEGDIQKWVDNTEVKGTNFTWYGPAPQVLIDLAMGGDPNNAPVSSSFPAVFSLDYFRVYVK